MKWNGKCNYDSSMKSNINLTGYVTLPKGDENILTQVIGTTGPVAAYVYASSDAFQLYTSGVYSDPSCSGKQVNHAVVLVGYGTDASGNQYYILRNSWGTEWGQYL